MDTSREFEAALQKRAKGIPVTMREIAVLIGNDPATLLKYMVDNDYIQVHKLLHLSNSNMVIGKNASFKPDRKRVEGELASLLTRKQWDTLNQVTDYFVINENADNYTSTPELIQKLCDIQVVHSTENGYEFDVILS